MRNGQDFTREKRRKREPEKECPDKRDKAISIGELSVLMELGFLWKERQKLLLKEIKLWHCFMW